MSASGRGGCAAASGTRAVIAATRSGYSAFPPPSEATSTCGRPSATSVPAATWMAEPVRSRMVRVTVTGPSCGRPRPPAALADAAGPSVAVSWIVPGRAPGRGRRQRRPRQAARRRDGAEQALQAAAATRRRAAGRRRPPAPRRARPARRGSPVDRHRHRVGHAARGGQGARAPGLSGAGRSTWTSPPVAKAAWSAPTGPSSRAGRAPASRWRPPSSAAAPRCPGGPASG